VVRWPLRSGAYSFSNSPLRLALLLGLTALLAIPAVAPTAHASSVGATGAPKSSGTISSVSALTCGPAGGASCSAHPAPPAPPPPGASVKPQTWTDLTGVAGTAPAARWLGAMVYDPVDGYVLLFGGYGPGGNYGDTWTFVHNQWTQLSLAGPGPRYAATLAWDAADGYAVLFGGYDSTTGVYHNDTWTYVHGTWTNITGTTNQTPPARWRAAMTYDAADGYVLLFGGTNSVGTAYSDTWKFLHGNWTKLTVTGSPPGRYRASMAFDPAGNDTVLFGGCTSTCPDSGTWTYRNLTWKSLSPSTHPGARVYYGFTYSSLAGSILLFGGSSSGASNVPLSDTWNYTNGTWTQLSLPRSPTAVAYLMMAFDPIDGYSVMYGGEWANGTYSDRTWVLGPSILGAISVSPATVDLTRSVAVNATPIGFSKYVAYDWVTLPPGCSAGNVSAFLCTPNATGAFSLVATLNDSLGVPRTENATISVSADPTLVSFRAVPSTVTVGSTVNLSVNASGGASPFTYQYVGLPPGCGSRNTTPLACVPGGTGGAYTVEAEVVDAAGFAIFANVSITVNPKPNVTGLAAYPAVLDANQNLTLRATVVGGTAPITYAYANLPSSCTSVNGPVLTCAPSAPFAGPVLVDATDAFGWSSHANVTVTVHADPRIVSAAAAPTATDAGSPVHFWVNVTNGTAPLTYHFSNAPYGCTLVAAAQTSCTPGAAGSFNLTVQVTDSLGYSVEATIPFTVNPALSLPAVGLSRAAIDLNQNVTVTAAPVGGTAPYTYAFKGLPNGCLTPAPGNGTVLCVPDRIGNSPIQVTVTDSVRESVTASATLTVRSDPSISSFSASPSPATVGSALTIAVNATGGSGGYSYSYRGLPPGCTNENRSPLVCAPTQPGTYVVAVTVTDSLGYPALAIANVTVAAAGATSTVLGIAPPTFYGLIAVVVIVVAIAALLLVRRRGPRSATPRADAEPWVEEPPASP
jgi:hypothetical protein